MRTSAEKHWPAALLATVALGAAWHVRTQQRMPHRPTNVVAQVGDRYIYASDLATAMADVTMDLQPNRSVALRRQVLEKLVDEEVLFQYGMQHRIFERDPVVRLALVRAMLPLMCGGKLPEAISRSSRPDAGEDDSACPPNDPRTAQRIDSYLAWLRTRVRVTESLHE